LQQDYSREIDDKGKQTPKKVGLAPVQREGMEYEFTVMLDVDMNHVASASKDRTSLFDGQYFKISEQTGTTLLQWLETGTDAPVYNIENIIKSISNSASIEVLKSHYDAAILMLPKEFTQRVIEAKDARKQQLLQPQEE